MVEEITLPRCLVNQLLHKAQNSPVNEVCGLIGALLGKATSCYPVTNIADQPQQRFLMDPKAQIAAIRKMRDKREELFAIYHSHPQSPPVPSSTDIKLNAYPEALHIIISLNTKGVLEMRAFRLIKQTQVNEVILLLEPE